MTGLSGDDAQLVRDLIARARRAMESYDGEWILIGGLAPIFYPHHPEFRRPPFDPLPTKDVDIALPRRLPVKGGKTVRASLAEVGVVAVETMALEPRGEIGAQRYQDQVYGERRGPAWIDFLTPLFGDEHYIVRPQPDLVAQAVKYLDLLMYQPVAVEVPEFGRLWLPHPFAFICQKQSIRTARPNDAKRRKDQADLISVAWSFEPWWDELAARAVILRDTPKKPWKAWVNRALKELRQLYASPASLGPIEAAAAAGAGGVVTPMTVHRVMQAFLAKMPVSP